jgi:hypothetical protein
MQDMSQNEEYESILPIQGYAPLPMNQFQSQKIDLLATALAKAQGAIVAPPRSRTVKVVPRTGGPGYSFKYATLSDIIDAVQKPLSENGIARLQLVSHEKDGGFYKLTTYLMHSSGQYIACEVPIIAEGHSNQQFGSALTYMKRYTLSAMVGIAADEDDDGNAADGNEVTAVADKAKPVAPNPIKTPEDKPNGNGVAKIGRIEVPFNPEEPDEKKAHDWLKFGQSYVATARKLTDYKDLVTLERANSMAIKNMEIHASKLFANMMVAMMQIKKDLEAANRRDVDE